ncbi:hypothetical protein [Almyronema epifaneia]|uniref:Uncharacterized protein n=1 Tax=Almyronema epifaneia S1 TaxID=2991925 RepID=A0ABW6IDZ3_9CYAN
MLQIRPRALMVPAGIAIALTLAGCGESKVTQCNRLAEVVNQTQGFMQEFETEIQSFSSNAASVQNLDDIKAAAGQYTTAVDTVVTNLDGLVTDLEETDLADETLVQFRDEYATVVQGFSSALQQASQAMELVVNVESEAELPASIEASQQQTVEAVNQIEQLSQTESEIINEVNTYCGAATPVEPAEGSSVEGETPAVPETESAE